MAPGEIQKPSSPPRVRPSFALALLGVVYGVGIIALVIQHVSKGNRFLEEICTQCVYAIGNYHLGIVLTLPLVGYLAWLFSKNPRKKSLALALVITVILLFLPYSLKGLENYRVDVWTQASQEGREYSERQCQAQVKTVADELSQTQKQLSLTMQVISQARQSKNQDSVIPDNFAVYVNSELGFSFSYPDRWGEVVFSSREDCAEDLGKDQKRDVGFGGKFTNAPGINFGATTQICLEREGGILDELWKLKGSPRPGNPADETKKLSRSQLAIWYVEKDWEDYYITASAPLYENTDFTGIGFTSRPYTHSAGAALDIETLGQDMKDFLTMVRSFELVP